MKTTLFIPVRNEIDGIKVIMPMIDKEWVDEILVVDGNSTDGTREWFEENGYKVIRQQSEGLCGAYWEGIEAATGDVIIPFSPDNNSLPELIPALIAKMEEGYDMVIASRYKDDATSEDDDPITAIGNWLFTKTTNLFLRRDFTDVLVMYRAFRKELLTELELDIRKIPAFEMQMLFRSVKAKLKIIEIPGDEPKRIGGQRKMQPIYNGVCLLYVMVREMFIWHPDPATFARELKTEPDPESEQSAASYEPALSIGSSAQILKA